MLKNQYRTAEDHIIDHVRCSGGSLTINFCTDDVPQHMVRALNRLVATGRLTKEISDNHLIHTWTLPAAAA